MSRTTAILLTLICLVAAPVRGIAPEAAQKLLAAADGELKTALMMALSGLEPGEARERLAAVNGVLREALAGLDRG